MFEKGTNVRHPGQFDVHQPHAGALQGSADHLEQSAVGQGVVRLSGQVLGDGPQAHPLIAALGGDLDLIHRVGVGQSQIGQGKKLAHKRDLLILWGVRPSV